MRHRPPPRSAKAVARPEGTTPDGRVITRKGPVIFVSRGVHREEKIVPCSARGPGKGAVVGDYVYLTGDVITHVAPRRTELIRVDALGDRPQIIAANVDVMFIVCAVEPPLREGLIDRYLVAAHASGIDAEIVFNKIDLFLDDDPEDAADFKERLAVYPPLGVPVHWCCAVEGRGLDTVRTAIDGRIGIFVGHSGTGKTSLLNALIPGAGYRVQELSEQSGRGRHTTTHTELYALPTGGEIIDSPGIRGFGLWAIAADKVKDHFVEFAAFATKCRFGDCAHDQEPNCAVKAAVEREKISPLRYEAYLRIRESIDDPGP
ncbi:MAG: ribosome small subunit-dependent GTPase A [Myxococcales bacterium]|nr:ribosome small subunit-dependent GTPase A [Myxococcales bacterium]